MVEWLALSPQSHARWGVHDYPKTAGGWFGCYQVRVRSIIGRAGGVVALDSAAQLPPLKRTEELGDS